MTHPARNRTAQPQPHRTLGPDRGLPRHLAALMLLGGVLACGHSEPFATPDRYNDGPLTTTPPIRLTYAPGANLRPAFSVDGREVFYSFVRGTTDRDRCLGALPAGGGSRTRTLCWEALGQEGQADGLEVGALAADGRLAFTWHSGTRFAIVPNTAGLYITRTGSVREAEKVLDLLTFQPAAGTAWDYLLDLSWSGPDEISALATDIVMINRCPPATCWDTTHVALHLATINVAQQPAVVTARAVPAGTTGIAVDPSTGRRYARTGIRVVELLANGGEAEVYTIVQLPSQSNSRITGLAAAAGRVVLTERFTFTNPPPEETIVETSQVRLIDGAQQSIIAAWVEPQGEFGGVTLDPSGRRVVVEGRRSGARDLFLLELP